MTEPMIEARGVGKTFGAVAALDSVSLSLDRGKVLGLLGHNGAGKTTLVNVLTTMLPPSSGSARVAGFDVTENVHEIRTRIGLTGQFASVDEQLSGRSNLVMVARLLGAGRRKAKDRADELLELFGLTDAALRPARHYSGGMRRRLDLASCIVGRPEVIFLDEPTTGLDPVSRRNLWTLLQGLVEDGATVLLTTQYLDEADHLADTITVLADGKVVAAGTPAELKAGVGQRTVTVTISAADDLGAATTGLERAGLDPRVNAEARTLTMPIIANREVAIVVRALDEVGIEASELALGEPTLDDVYLAVAKTPLPVRV
ncbi:MULTISPECIES: ATP-binding cassette domain-containing protein [Actinoalloteichus]|uniref:Daunorubicin resistance ABC transporter ATP-binding subunit n=1 Tax=Actinoalloteichus fjordicus TaxID=1612552 RepID=A0AAC9PST4_9PSEU|nr:MULTISPECIES: ATP-binding cassette domain-containing protein [Actinoalloteichus]APU15337.1 daunorubicin resistance ABC transporter ATP-binding subunit [Actinoalloteichus fjordicus]APU21403.1 daunorubicin resistance ABC transporter ATP-binding subunit [Actinoalloteichus sp. GBA129-24]